MHLQKQWLIFFDGCLISQFFSSSPLLTHTVCFSAEKQAIETCSQAQEAGSCWAFFATSKSLIGNPLSPDGIIFVAHHGWFGLSHINYYLWAVLAVEMERSIAAICCSRCSSWETRNSYRDHSRKWEKIVWWLRWQEHHNQHKSIEDVGDNIGVPKRVTNGS